MPEPTFLQIQGGGDSSTRMIELPPGPVRIGRGPHCEVRLGDPGLGDVHCMLRRRGATWHFQPVGPSGHVWIDGRAADQQRPIPLGVPFRVGEHWLILRPADSAASDWGTFDAPISVEAQAEAGPDSEQAATPADGPPRPRSAPPSDDNEERLRRWEARLEQRERWLKDRQEERRWEARWKSAGESIRARSTPPVAPPPRTPAPTPPPASSPRMPHRPSQTPPVARIIEPRVAEPIRRVADPTPKPPAPRVVVRPLPDPPAVFRRPVAPPGPRVEIRPEPPKAPPSRALVTLAPSPSPIAPAEPSPEVALELAPVEVDRPESRPVEEVAADEPIEADGPGHPEVHSATIASPPQPSLAMGEGAMVGSAERTVVVDEDRDLPADIAGSCAVRGADPTCAPETLESPRPDATASLPQADEPERPLEASILVESSSWLEEELPIAIEEARLAEIAPRTPELPQEPPTPELPRKAGLAKGEWPSARAIFAAQGRRTRPEPEPAPDVSKPARRQAVEPQPTDVLGPACWSMPLWLGWLPVLVASVTVGLVGMALAYEWAIEANNANVAIRLAMRPVGAPGSSIDPTLIPRGGWWTSTATHQAAWALALVRADDGEDHSEDIRSLLDSSRNTSRLAARSRFVVELPPADAPGSPPDLSHLGRTRDVVTLVWTGRRLRKEGKLDSAIRAYRSAMEIASKASLEDLDPPIFFDDPQVRRYALPREALLAFVAKAMAEDGEWTQEQWAEALPPSATASLVASRVFARMQKRADADRLADLAIRQAEAPTPPGYDPAEDRAAGAEALAYRGRWTDAAEQYRLAIDQAEDDATRRMWWLNLAEVAQRTGDDAGRVRAIEAAKAPSSVDEITRRALKYQQSLPGLVSTGPRH